MTNCYQKTLRDSRDRVPKESRRGATVSEVASLMSHVSLAVNSRERAIAVKSTRFHRNEV